MSLQTPNGRLDATFTMIHIFDAITVSLKSCRNDSQLTNFPPSPKDPYLDQLLIFPFKCKIAKGAHLIGSDR